MFSRRTKKLVLKINFLTTSKYSVNKNKMDNDNEKLIKKEENVKTKEDIDEASDNYYCCALVTIIVLICICLLVFVFYLVAIDK